MLINLSNHPSSKWSAEQMDTALKVFGGVRDFPFPEIDPGAGIESIKLLAEKVFNDISCSTDSGFSVHVMGEFTFCYQFISLCEKKKIRCYASTTKRDIYINSQGDKISKFKFIQFRLYN